MLSGNWDLTDHGREYIMERILLICPEKNIKIPKDASVFRTGGDEFVAFLPGTGEEEARKMIREMKQSALTYQVMGHPLSVSFGSSTILTKEDSVTDCLKCSDKRMYRDKREKKAAR